MPDAVSPPVCPRRVQTANALTMDDTSLWFSYDGQRRTEWSAAKLRGARRVEEPARFLDIGNSKAAQSAHNGGRAE